MNEALQRVIEEIHSRGNTAEIKQRKDDVVVLEVVKKIVYKYDRQKGACYWLNGADGFQKWGLSAFLFKVVDNGTI